MSEFFTGHLNFQTQGVGEAGSGRVRARSGGIAGHNQGQNGLRRGGFEGVGPADHGSCAGAESQQVPDRLEVRRPRLREEPGHVERLGLKGALEDGRLLRGLLKELFFAGDPRTAPRPFPVPVDVRRSIRTGKNPHQRFGIGAFAGDDTGADGPQD